MTKMLKIVEEIKNETELLNEQEKEEIEQIKLKFKNKRLEVQNKKDRIRNMFKDNREIFLNIYLYSCFKHALFVNLY